MVSKKFVEKIDGLKVRDYKGYEEYVKHQKSKLAIIPWLDEYDLTYREALNKRLKQTKIDFKGAKVLCLGARIGTEVKSFIDQGCFAIGTDLNPGEGNKYVVHGDFHDIQFADDTVDIVFTNAIDHSLQPTKLIKEVRRVLNPGGILILEVGRGTKDEHGTGAGSYECLEWEKVDQVVELVVKEGFVLEQRNKTHQEHRFVGGGEQLVFVSTLK